MKCYQDLQTPEGELAAALGSFDGLHLGHRQVIGNTLSAPGLRPAVITFQQNPLVSLQKKSVPLLTTNEQKLALLEEMGVEVVYLLPFEQIRNMEPEDFVEALYRVCRVRALSCGFNFRFGKNGRGDAGLLKELCQEKGISLSVTPPVSVAGETVSSTRIRACLEQGDVQQAGQLLGRPFGYDFEVTHGRQLGRTWGTPTINQPFPQGYVLPRFGVYASLVEVEGQKYYGVTNIGVKPTVGSDCALSETWIPEFSGDLYGKKVPVELLDFIRPERKFDSLDQLKNEILENGVLARKIAQREWKDPFWKKSR